MLEKSVLSIICGNYVNSRESDTSYGDFMVKFTRRLSGNLIYHAFFSKTPDNLQIIFTIKFP